MPGGDEIGLELLAERPEFAEFEPIVANNARIRRSSREILIGEIVDDAVEFLFEVQSIERNVEPIRNAPAIACIDRGAASLLAIRPTVVRAMNAGAHEKSDHVVSLLFQQIRAHGAIHPAAHRQYDTLGQATYSVA